jgi:predicted esterase
MHNRKRELPRETRQLLGDNNHSLASSSYLHSQDGKGDTNLLIMFHGAGDTHHPFVKLFQQLQLPQTACLAIDASCGAGTGSGGRPFVELPFGLGFTWFEELDYQETGLPLPHSHPRRIESLKRAVQYTSQTIQSLTPELSTKKNDNGWPSERIFILGYGAGATLAMEVAAELQSDSNKHAVVLGGVINIHGGMTPSCCDDDGVSTSTRASPSNMSQLRQLYGTKVGTQSQYQSKEVTATHTTTPVLVLTGSRDPNYTEADAFQSAHAYDEKVNTHFASTRDRTSDECSRNVQVHVQQGKGSEMIGKYKEEMTVLMTFLASKLVQYSAVPEGCTEIS